jgi:hypothetical protein
MGWCFGAGPVGESPALLLLLGGDGDPDVCGFPADVELGLGAMGVGEGDAHLVLGGGERVLVHGDADEVLRLVVFGAPLAGLLIDDELPGAFGREGVEGVVAGGDGGVADFEGGVGFEVSGGVGAGAPDLAVRDDVAHDFAAAHEGGVVVDHDGFAGEGDVGVGGRTHDGLGGVAGLGERGGLPGGHLHLGRGGQGGGQGGGAGGEGEGWGEECGETAGCGGHGFSGVGAQWVRAVCESGCGLGARELRGGFQAGRFQAGPRIWTVWTALDGLDGLGGLDGLDCLDCFDGLDGFDGLEDVSRQDMAADVSLTGGGLGGQCPGLAVWPVPGFTPRAKCRRVPAGGGGGRRTGRRRGRRERC